jgi:epoxide hydrolase-like predicted phosphatase
VSRRRAVFFDYGGVLTRPVASSFAAFEREHRIDPGRSFELLVAASRSRGGGPIGALERGEMTVESFDAALRSMLADAGYPPPPDGSLLAGLFAGMTPHGQLWGVAAQARAAGVTTALLSNSWGTAMYPWDRIDAHFDVAVVSGQVGLRKPDAAIYRLAMERVGVPPGDCAFVDDLERNVEVARDLGMYGIHHVGDDAATSATLGAFLGLEFTLA